MNRVAQLEGEIASLRRVLKRMKGERQDLDDEAAACPSSPAANEPTSNRIAP